MRRTILILAGVVGAGVAQAKGVPGTGTLNLVPAQCEGPPPGPCAPDFTFTRGSMTLLGSKQPKPTCPKTGKPEESPAGTVKMTGVTSAGAPFSGTLSATITYTATFGEDANHNCDLRGLSLTVPSLVGDVVCANGRCKGTLLPFACLPKQCADGPVTTELASIVITNGTTPVARPGTILAPQAADAP